MFGQIINFFFFLEPTQMPISMNLSLFSCQWVCFQSTKNISFIVPGWLDSLVRVTKVWRQSSMAGEEGARETLLICSTWLQGSQLIFYPGQEALPQALEVSNRWSRIAASPPSGVESKQLKARLINLLNISLKVTKCSVNFNNHSESII